jgi:hypothetical protein
VVSRKASFWLFFVSSTIYFFMSPKIFWGSNEGAHFVLLQALEEKSFPVLTDSLMSYVGYVGFSEYKGRRYSDRPPGMALLAVPVFYAAKALTYFAPLQLSPPEPPLCISGAAQNNEDIFPLRSFGIGVVHLIPIFASAATLVLFFQFLCLYAPNPKIPIFLTILFGFGTVFVKYATVFFSHNVSCLFAMAAVFLLFEIRRGKLESLAAYGALGLVLGFMALLEYQMILVGLGAGLLILVDSRKFFHLGPGQRINSKVCSLLVWGAFPVVLMALYQIVLFHNPLATTYSHHGFYIYARTWTGLFSGSLIVGLKGLLLAVRNHGLFVVSPFILIGIVGALTTLQRNTIEKGFLLSVAVLHILWISKHREWHGGGFYPRYIGWSSMLLCLCASLWFMESVGAAKKAGHFFLEFLTRVSPLVFIMAALYSLWANLADLPQFFPSTKVSQLARPGDHLANLYAYFPGLHHWSLWVFVWILVLAWSRIRQAVQGQEGPKIVSLQLCLIIGAGLFLVGRMARVSEWRSRQVLFIQNFSNLQADPAEREGQSLPMVLKLLEGDGVYVCPQSFGPPGELSLALPPLSKGRRLFVSADFTVTGKNNSVQAFVTPQGQAPIEVFRVTSKGQELRYDLTRELKDIDLTKPGNELKFRLQSLPGSIAQFDSRLEFIEVFAI